MKAQQVIENWLQTSQQTGAGQVDQAAGQASIQFPKGTPNIPVAVPHHESPPSPAIMGAITPVSAPRDTVNHDNTATPSNLVPSNRVNNDISAPVPHGIHHHNNLATTPSISNGVNNDISAPVPLDIHHHNNLATTSSISNGIHRTTYPLGLNPEAPTFISNNPSTSPSPRRQRRKYSSPGSFALLLTTLSRLQLQTSS